MFVQAVLVGACVVAYCASKRFFAGVREYMRLDGCNLVRSVIALVAYIFTLEGVGAWHGRTCFAVNNHFIDVIR